MVQVIVNGAVPPHCAAAVATDGVTGNVVKAVLVPTLTADHPRPRLVSNCVQISAGTLVMAIVKLDVLPVTVIVPPVSVVIVEPDTEKSLGTLLAEINVAFREAVP